MTEEHRSNEAWMQSLLILDRTLSPAEADPLYAFALDELLCRATGEGGAAICHLWRHPSAFIMGLRDSRLPQVQEAVQWLEAQGYRAAVRNSGGAAVPLDPGVINLSLILPKQQAADMQFHEDFDKMYALIRLATARLGGSAAKGEVLGSYCPGEFDLSIAGRKFCGIAQRRQVRAYNVQAFVIAEGEGLPRARLVREFYRRAAAGADPDAYPEVTTESMASLAELTGQAENTAVRFAEAVKAVIRSHHTQEGLAAAEAALRLPAQEEIQAMADTMRTRYGIAERPA